MARSSAPNSLPNGFTLVELTIVLVIVGLLVGGLTVTLSAVQDSANIKETEKRLALAHDAVLGFAVAHGRLPCPAANASNGAEAFSGVVGNSPCTTYHLNSFLPAATLGLAPTDENGFMIDAWGQRIRYAVSSDPTSGDMSSNAASVQRHSFTNTSGMANLAAADIVNRLAALHPDLHVCTGNAAPVATMSVQCNSTTLTDQAVAVIFSRGRNGPQGVDSVDEQGNTDGDRIFVSRIGNDFDDLVTWLSPNVLYNRMITAGRLP